MFDKRLKIMLICFLLAIAALVPGCSAPTTTEPEPVIEGEVTVSVNLESGVWSPEDELVFSNEYDLPICYTTDGAMPTADSVRYESPIMLKDIPQNKALTDHDEEMTLFDYHIYEYDGTTEARVIRAAVVMPDGTMGPVMTKTYFLMDDLSERYGCAVISIVTDPYNLYDYEKGILVKGKLYDEYLAENGGQPPQNEWEGKGNYSIKGRDWERPAYIQMFDGSNKAEWESPCGIRVRGSASRVYTQRSFNIYFREDYGQKKLEYDLIPGNQSIDGKPINTYKNFSLRNGGNDTMSLKFRDDLIQDLFSGMRFSTQYSRPAIVYLNGEYYGIFSLIEKYDGRYVEDHYGVDSDNVIIIEDGVLDEGEDSDITMFEQLMNTYGFSDIDLTDPDKWKAFCDVVDVQSMADYYAAEIYIANADWADFDNCRLWRARTNDGTEYGDTRWRWMMFGTEYSIGQYLSTPEIKRYFPLESTSASWNTFEDSFHNNPLFTNAMKNPEFRAMFSESMHKIAEEYMEPTKAVKRLEEYYALWSRWYPDFSARFGAGDEESYRQEFEIVKDFLQTRPQYIIPIVDEYCG